MAKASNKARRLSGFKGLEEINEVNDDEAELAQVADLKREEAEKRAQASSPYRETPGHQRRAKLLDSYADCIKMCTENKVNEKNSWSLDLIDNLGRVIDEPASNGEQHMTNFQRASCTLEAGIKIYSYRVDSVYTETFKLMGGLNRTSKRNGAEGEGEAEAEGADEEGVDEGGGGAPQKKDRATRQRTAAPAGTAFLEANPAALGLKKLELAFDVDPLFHRTSAKFDEGGAKGLLLHNLPVQRGCSLVFDSSDGGPPSGAEAGARPAAPAEAAPAPLPLRCISNLIPRNCLELHVSSEFSARHEAAACEWAGGSGRPVPSDALPAESDGEAEGEADDEPELGPADAGFDDDAGFDELPPDNDDAPFGDDGAPADDRDEALLRQAEQGEGEGRLAILSLDEMVAEHEQGHEQTAEAIVHEKAQQLLQVGQRWAGPGHWKFHAAKAAKAAGGGGGGGKTKSAFVLDFGRRAEALKALQEMPRAPKGTTLSDAALAKASDADHTLPEDCQCSVDALCRLFHKPELRVRRGAHARRAPPSRDGAAADDGAPDAADAASDGGDGEIPDFGDDWGSAADQGAPALDDEGGGAAPLPPSALDEFELVSQPTRVQKIDIGYAKVAKQVDISALKHGLWELLVDEKSAGDPAARRMSGEASFQQVVSRLPEKIPEQKLPDISLAYNFICLLHLANEKGLEITGSGDFSDLRVTQPAPPPKASAK